MNYKKELEILNPLEYVRNVFEEHPEDTEGHCPKMQYIDETYFKCKDLRDLQGSLREKYISAI